MSILAELCPREIALLIPLKVRRLTSYGIPDLDKEASSLAFAAGINLSGGAIEIKFASSLATNSAFRDRPDAFAAASALARRSRGIRNLNWGSFLLMSRIMDHRGLDSNGTTVVPIA